jgi:hypothetical protein
MPEQTTKGKRDTSNIQFFGEIDLNDHGGIRSEMPAWYLERHIEELEESINKKETALKFNRIAPDVVPRMREEIKAEKEKLEKIKGSKPELNDSQKDRCASTYEKLEKHIRDTMPTRKQTKDGLVNPYDELKRMKSHHIPIDTQMAKMLGVKAVNGKITGDAANKCYQILGKMLGENTSIERLRRDSGVESFQTVHDFVRAINEGRKIEGA